MKTIFASLAVLTAVSAQQCTCDSEPAKGFWEGTTCGTCDLTQTDQAAADGRCVGYSYCAVGSDRPRAERLCYGAGTCNTAQSPASPAACLCTNANVVGEFCDECASGWVDWPSCSTPKCLDGGATCNNHGTCDDADMPISCWVTDAETALSYRPLSQKCVSLQGPDGGTYKMVQDQYQNARKKWIELGTICQAGKKNPSTLCAWNQKCFKQDRENPTCCALGTKMCKNALGVASGCIPDYQTCCDGTGCAIDEACSIRVEDYTIPVTAEEWPGVVITAKGGWRTPDKKKYRDLPRQCVAEDKMMGPTAVRVIFMPVMLTLTTLASFGIMHGTTGLSPVKVGGPAALIVLCACLTYFSWLWTYGIVLSLSAFVALGGAHKGGSTQAFSMLFQVVALAIVCGGMGLGSLVVESNDAASAVFPATLASPSVSGWAVSTYCKDYFGFFNLVDANRPPTLETSVDSSGYCALGWISFVYLGASIAVACKVVMLVGTGSSYLEGSPGKKM